MTEFNLACDLPKNQDQLAWFYNGIDCLVTHEVLSELSVQLSEAESCVRDTYAFALAKQAPIMEMELRGIAVSPFKKERVLRELEADEKRVRGHFDYLCRELFSTTVNPRSPVQVKQLFYDRLGLPPVKKRNNKGVWAPSVDEESLNTLKRYYEAQPFSNFILCLRDLGKQISFLKSMGDRLFTSFLVAGTVTGRLASKYSDFGVGTNLQNIDRRLRQIFVADKDMVLVNVDLEQADARNVGAIMWSLLYETHGAAYAGKYLDACESGDVHTAVARLVWPKLAWTGNLKEDRKIADEPFYRQDSYRQASKKTGHATNYRGKPVTLAKRTNIPVGLIKAFQARYYEAFPSFGDWYAYIKSLFETYPGVMTTLYGRKRTFFGRHNDAQTLRDATAYEPQSMTGHQIDLALHAVWRQFPSVQLLLQVHDNILFQLPKTDLSFIPEICSTMEKAHAITLVGNRRFFVPVEAKYGNNWGDYDEEKNPGGLKKFP